MGYDGETVGRQLAVSSSVVRFAVARESSEATRGLRNRNGMKVHSANCEASSPKQSSHFSCRSSGALELLGRPLADAC